MIPSRYIDDKSSLQSDWTKPFRPIICEPEFSRIFAESYRTEPKHLYYTYFTHIWWCNSTKKQNTGSILTILVLFSTKGIFSQNFWLSCTTPYEPLTLCWVSEKNYGPLPKKLMDRWTNERAEDPSSQYQESSFRSNYSIN